MNVIGISPLDKDATVSLVVDGVTVFAAAEERYSRKKQHAGFPHKAMDAALRFAGLDVKDIDQVGYAFLGGDEEARLIHRCMEQERNDRKTLPRRPWARMLREARQRIPERTDPIHGLAAPDEKMEKGSLKEWAYHWFGLAAGASDWMGRRMSRRWAEQASQAHRHWHGELETELRRLGLDGKLKRFEHHLSHAANAYYASGHDRALIVTIDGYGTGLAGSVSLGEGGRIRRLHNLRFPYSLGTFYETVTASLGYSPDRHAGKIVGLAAYGDPDLLGEALLSRFDVSTPGDYRILDNLSPFFSRVLASHFPKIDVAAAYQHVLEVVATGLVAHWAREVDCSTVVLSGGVVANVKLNQRIHELEEIEQTFVYPNMGDGGCGTGIAYSMSLEGQVGTPVPDVYLGPEFSPQEIEAVLKEHDLTYTEPSVLAEEVARKVHEGQVVARFAGRMEYGPRALGNRSILYHAREPDVNHWLNQRLGRTEFMPFAPVTLWEARDRCYHGVAGAEHAAQFMTITFDCTDWMQERCPAAIHVDGTARPQLIRKEVNPGYYDILVEYEKLSGIPCLINTSFNMHEEPIVCTPRDAVRAFLAGHLDYLAIGPYWVPNPRGERGRADRREETVGV